ncbi:MAG: hemolysin family protein [Nibricoccus sp.]
MSEISTELFILFLLLLANGVFAMAEIAVVSARKARLKQLADEGSESARTTLSLANEPTRFLSAVQVAISLLTVLQGAFTGASFGEKLAPLFAQLPWLSAENAYKVAFGVSVVAVTFASVVVGELIPKRLGLTNPEKVAMILGPMVNSLTWVFLPVVSLLTFVTESLLKLFGVKQQKETPVTEEEVNILIEQGRLAGVFNKTESEMVAGVLELDQLPVTALMTPRPKIVFINIDDPEEASWRKIVASGHSHFPVFQGSRDQVVGMVSVKALWAHSAIGLTTNLKNLLVQPLVVPETMNSIQLLEAFKKSSKHIALVSDEFGAIQGLVTLIDVLEAIVGDLPAQGRRQAASMKQREDGSWLVDATLSTDELKTLLQVDELPHEEEADFQTLGGFVMTHFGRIPSAGDYFDHGGWRFEVMDMDRHRVDKMLICKTPAPAALEKAAG